LGSDCGIPGDRVHVRTPGGGGYGDPLVRDPEAVLEDVRLERYTVAQAREMFGVELSGSPMAVDASETARLRVAGVTQSAMDGGG
jgi:N-methylhydantoinase B